MKTLIPFALLVLSACELKQNDQASGSKASASARSASQSFCVNSVKHSLTCAAVTTSELGLPVQLCTTGTMAGDEGLAPILQEEVDAEVGLMNGDQHKVLVRAGGYNPLRIGYTDAELAAFPQQESIYIPYGILVTAQDSDIFLSDSCQAIE